jgi:SAM-dependent methyltransferase
VSYTLKLEEVEELGYYDFMGYLGVPFFNVGGFVSINRLAELCQITAHTRVLEVGCGTGANACYLTEKYGYSVVGIDISEYMVKYGVQRATDYNLGERVSFKVGDAY